MTSTAGGGGVIPKVDEVKEAVRNLYCLSVPKVDGGEIQTFGNFANVKSRPRRKWGGLFLQRCYQHRYITCHFPWHFAFMTILPPHFGYFLTPNLIFVTH